MSAWDRLTGRNSASQGAAQQLPGVEVRATDAGVPDVNPGFWLGMGYSNNVSTKDIEQHPYAYHWAIYATARNISSNIARLPRYIERTGERAPILSHPFLSLLKKPCPGMTQTTFWQFIALYLLLPTSSIHHTHKRGGQAFIIPLMKGEKIDCWAGEEADIMMPWSDEFFEPVIDRATGTLTEWKFEVPGLPGSKEIYKPNQIIRIYNVNPYDRTRGLSYAGPAWFAVTRDIYADIWNQNMFENDATPGGVLTSEQQLHPEKVREMRKQWYEMYSGPTNARRIAILSQGLKFQATSTTAKDMEFTKLKEETRDQILGTMGLNKIAIGRYEDVNYSTLFEGRKMLWQDTYQPIDDSICEQISSQWISKMNPRAEECLRADYAKIPALRQDYTKPVSVAKQLYSMGIPAYRALQIAELPLSEEDLTKYPWLNEQPPTQGLGGLFGGGETIGTDADKAPATIEAIRARNKKLSRKLTPEALARFSDDYIKRVLEPGEKYWLPKFIKLLISQRNAMQDNVDKWEKSNDKSMVIVAKATAHAGQFLLDIHGEIERLTELYSELVGIQLNADYDKLKEELPLSQWPKAARVSWNVTDHTIHEFVSERRTELHNITTTTLNKARDKINDAVDSAIRDGLTVPQTARKIKDAIADAIDIRQHHARTIARTEVGSISSKARNAMFRDVGVEYHEWTTANDEKVRDTHAGINGEVVKIGEKFGTTGLAFPLDPDGSAEEIINCRCATIAVPGPGAGETDEDNPID